MYRVGDWLDGGARHWAIVAQSGRTAARVYSEDMTWVVASPQGDTLASGKAEDPEEAREAADAALIRIYGPDVITGTKGSATKALTPSAVGLASAKAAGLTDEDFERINAALRSSKETKGELQIPSSIVVESLHGEFRRAYADAGWAIRLVLKGEGKAVFALKAS